MDLNLIRSNLAQVREDQYRKNNYQPVKKAYQSRVKRETDSNYHLKTFCEQLNINAPDDFEKKKIDVTSLSHYNVIGESELYVPWSKLTNEKRLQLIENYFATEEGNMYTPDIKNSIIEMIKNNKLKRKSDIDYDQINCKVVKIKAIKMVEGKNCVQVDKSKKRSKIKKMFSSC